MKKYAPRILIVFLLLFGLSYAQEAFAQYNYTTPTPVVPTPIAPTAAPTVNTTNTSGSSMTTVNPAVPNTGAGGEAGQNIFLLSISALGALAGLILAFWIPRNRSIQG